MSERPRKSWSAGAQKAHARMTAEYGTEAGERRFYGKAVAHMPKNLTLNEKVSGYYATGGTQK